jgi:probable lipoprotein NlpC
MATSSDPAQRVVEVAKSWVGRDFNPGVEAQCAPFVRHVFAEAGVPVGNAAHPTDAHLLYASDGLSPNFANSFAGDDVGIRVSLSEAQPGDIVMFKNTYGNWREGVLTHVGIYVGNGMMVDRSTMAHPVATRSVYTFSGGPWEIRRPKAFCVPKTRIALDQGKLTGMVKGSKSFALDVKVELKGVLKTWVNNSPVSAKAVYLKVRDKMTGIYYRLSMEGGLAKASANHQAVDHLHCRFNLQAGALHVWVNAKEVRSDEAAVEIVHTA